MRAMHEHPVPEESKEEEKTKCCNECDEEFFPVHNFFRLRFFLNPISPAVFIAKSRSAVDLKFAAGAEHALAPGRDWRGRRETKPETTKPVCSVIRISSFFRH